MNEDLRVLFSCTGIGILNRGVESSFRDAFDGLKDTPGLSCCLLKGAGPDQHREERVWCLPRTGIVAQMFGKIVRRSSYVVEQLSSFPSVVKQIRQFRPNVIFYGDANLGFQLYRWRRYIGVPFKLLYQNGGGCRPPFTKADFVHQVGPLYYQESLAAGDSPRKHFLLPHGINLPGRSQLPDTSGKRNIRLQLGVPVDRIVILSVGAIHRDVKRMHYVIEEVARMPVPRPFLQLLGAMDEKSKEVVETANRLLGPGNFSARSVPYEKVGDYYQSADIFVLASLKEGFGRVFLEALMHGLPTIGHRHPVIEFVLGKEGIAADLSQPGRLTSVLTDVLTRPNTEAAMIRRWQSVHDRFSWEILRPQYHQMFRRVAEGSGAPPNDELFA